MDKEIWKDVKGLEEFYQISNYGQLKSKDRTVRNISGYFTKKGKILKPQPNSNGYLRFDFRGKESEAKRLFIHRVVAEAFIPNPGNKPQVNHIDFDYTNNRSSNLEWVTASENSFHSVKAGRFDELFAKTTKIFSEHRKLKHKPVIGINRETGHILKFPTINSAGRHFGGAAGDICNCCQRKRQQARGYIWRYAE